MSMDLLSVSNAMLEHKGLIKVKCGRERRQLLFRTEYFFEYWLHGEILLTFFSPFNNTYCLMPTYFGSYISRGEKLGIVLFGFHQQNTMFSFEVVEYN